jgi:hypothetical protein
MRDLSGNKYFRIMIEKYQIDKNTKQGKGGGTCTTPGH